MTSTRFYLVSFCFFPTHSLRCIPHLPGVALFSVQHCAFFFLLLLLLFTFFPFSLTSAFLFLYLFFSHRKLAVLLRIACKGVSPSVTQNRINWKNEKKKRRIPLDKIEWDISYQKVNTMSIVIDINRDTLSVEQNIRPSLLHQYISHSAQAKPELKGHVSANGKQKCPYFCFSFVICLVNTTANNGTH